MSEQPSDDDPLVRQDNFREALAAATPTAFVTPALIAINVLVFLAMIVGGVSFLQPTAQQVLPWGANFGPMTASGQWWRLLTACFLHFGIIHLGMNMFILFQVGIFTEKLFGNLRFLLLYLLAGIGGNIAGLYFHPLTVAAGASGAVFGVYGGLLGFLLIERGVVPSQSAFGLAKSAAIFLVYNLIYGLATPETDLVAHIAGLLTGFVAGCLLARPLSPAPQHHHPLRTLAVALGAAAAAFAGVAFLPKINPAGSEWYRLMLTAPRVTVGVNDEVVYSGAATRADAEKLGKALVSLNFFRKPRITVLLTKDAGGTSISIPLEGDESQRPSKDDNITTKFVNGKSVIVHSDEAALPMPWENPALLESMKVIGESVSASVGGPPLTIRLLNGKGELKNEVKIDSSQVMIGLRDRVSYSGTASADDARALGQALRNCGVFMDTGAIVHLTKGSGSPVVAFHMGNAHPREQLLATVGARVSRSVGGPPVIVQWLDLDGRVAKELVVKK